MKTKWTVLGFCGFALISIAAGLALAHLKSASAQINPEQRFQVNGVVRSLENQGQTVVIEHDDIPDFMPAMIMPFTVRDAALLRGLQPGEAVRFELVVTKEDSWIDRIEKRTGSAQETARGGERAETERPAAPEPREIEIGEIVPNFALIDQDGHSIHLRDYRGKAVVLTFIYTRCPLPNFCPLMSKNFADLQQRLSQEFTDKYQLLSITMDPDFDRPEVLKHYAARYGANEKDWSFATGTADQISFVAGLMGLYYAKEGGLISHDFRTALIGPDGRLLHLWKSNVWTPYEVQRMVRETLAPSKDVASQ